MYVTLAGIQELFDSCDSCPSPALNQKHAVTRSGACTWLKNVECEPGNPVGYQINLATGSQGYGNDGFNCECDDYFVHVEVEVYNGDSCDCEGVPLGVGSFNTPRIHWIKCFTQAQNCETMDVLLDYAGDNGDHDPGGGGCTGGTCRVSAS